MVHLLTNSQIARALVTTKQYIKLEDRSTNHALLVASFTNNYAPTKAVGEGREHWIDVAASMPDILNEAREVVKKISRAWGRDCYYYGSFDQYLEDFYGLTEYKYQVLLQAEK